MNKQPNNQIDKWTFENSNVSDDDTKGVFSIWQPPMVYVSVKVWNNQKRTPSNSTINTQLEMISFRRIFIWLYVCDWHIDFLYSKIITIFILRVNLWRKKMKCLKTCCENDKINRIILFKNWVQKLNSYHSYWSNNHHHTPILFYVM